MRTGFTNTQEFTMPTALIATTVEALTVPPLAMPVNGSARTRVSPKHPMHPNTKRDPATIAVPRHRSQRPAVYACSAIETMRGTSTIFTEHPQRFDSDLSSVLRRWVADELIFNTRCINRHESE